MTLSYDRDRADYFETCREAQSIPGNDALKLILLERLLEEFDGGEVYTKSEVDARISRYFDEHVTLRRELVNFGYLRYDNRANEYTVVKRTLSEDDVRDNSRLARHAKDLGVLEES